MIQTSDAWVEPNAQHSFTLRVFAEIRMIRTAISATNASPPVYVQADAMQVASSTLPARLGRGRRSAVHGRLLCRLSWFRVGRRLASWDEPYAFDASAGPESRAGR